MEDNLPRFLCAALIATASISAAPALAQDSYPNKPIKIVLPVPPGSALDIATRAIGEQLSVRWGQQVLIEARPGAGGLIARQAVASAPPDGYTLLGGPASLFTILPAQKDKLPIDVNKSFVQLGMVVGSGVMFIAVSPKLGRIVGDEPLILGVVRGGVRARTHERHAATQHIEQLRQLVEAHPPQPAADAGDARIVPGGLANLRTVLQHAHGAKLEDAKRAPVEAVECLGEQHRHAWVEVEQEDGG